MNTTGNYRKKPKKQSAKRGLLRRSAKVDRRRVKRITLPLGVVITFRRFKTNSKRRSKVYKQSVYPFRLVGYKEVAIALGKKRKPKTTLLWLPRNVAKMVIVAIIVVNAVTFIVLQGNKSDLGYVVTQIPAPGKVAYIGQSTNKVMPKSLPQRLVIPEVGIDTNLIKLGRQADGTLELPEKFDVAGWYKYSPTPGELGPSVIVGHVDSYKGIAVFWNLRLLKPKQIIKVYRADGSVAEFSVTAVKEVSQNDFPTKEVYGKINYAGLRLITCGGQFSKELHRYNHNIVVFGKLVTS